MLLFSINTLPTPSHKRTLSAVRLALNVLVVGLSTNVFVLFPLIVAAARFLSAGTQHAAVTTLVLTFYSQQRVMPSYLCVGGDCETEGEGGFVDEVCSWIVFPLHVCISIYVLSLLIH